MLHFNIQWKYALNVPLDYEGFDDSLLTYFRARLLTNHKEKILFRKTLELAKEAGLIKSKIDQVIDSTPILGAGAVKDTYELIRDGIKKVISLLDKKRRSGMNLSFLIEAIPTLYVDKASYNVVKSLQVEWIESIFKNIHWLSSS